MKQFFLTRERYILFSYFLFLFSLPILFYPSMQHNVLHKLIEKLSKRQKVLLTSRKTNSLEKQNISFTLHFCVEGFHFTPDFAVISTAPRKLAPNPNYPRPCKYRNKLFQRYNYSRKLAVTFTQAINHNHVSTLSVSLRCTDIYVRLVRNIFFSSSTFYPLVRYGFNKFSPHEMRECKLRRANLRAGGIDSASD